MPPPPPPPAPKGTTIFGYNTGDPEGLTKMQRWGKLPMARVYNDYRTLGPGHFQPGGLLYVRCGVGVPGVVTSKRANMSVLMDPRQVTGPDSPLAVEMRNFAAIVPQGWYVQIVLHHEYNLHTTDFGTGETGCTNAQFQAAFPILAQAILDGDAGAGRCVPVVNPSWDSGAFNLVEAPHASDMPPGTQFHWDYYDNPAGYPLDPGGGGKYKGMGSWYNPVNRLQKAYDTIVSLGYDNPAYGWGIDEINAPRRVAPPLPTFNSRLGWGPLSPHDVDGSGMAQSITDMAQWCLNAPVPPTTFLLFTQAGNQFNQKFTTAGGEAVDDWLDANGNPMTPPLSKTQLSQPRTPGPLNQGYPIPVDPAKPYAAYQALIDISA